MFLKTRIITGAVFDTLASDEVRDALTTMNKQVKQIVRDRDDKLDELKALYKKQKAITIKSAKESIQSARNDFKQVFADTFHYNVERRMALKGYLKVEKIDNQAATETQGAAA